MEILGSFLILRFLPHPKKRFIEVCILIYAISSLVISFYIDISRNSFSSIYTVNPIKPITLAAMLFLWLIYALIHYSKESDQNTKKSIGTGVLLLGWSALLTLLFIFVMKKNLFLPPFIFLLNSGATIYFLVRYYWSLINSQKASGPGLCFNSKLTAREKEIAHLLTQGLTYQEIAEKLFISFTTVNTHTIKIYKKTKVKNRHDLTIAINNSKKSVIKSKKSAGENKHVLIQN